MSAAQLLSQMLAIGIINGDIDPKIYRISKLILMLRPNQSLKLTEPAVDDLAARCWTDSVHLTGTSAQRTTLRRLFAAAA